MQCCVWQKVPADGYDEEMGHKAWCRRCFHFIRAWLEDLLRQPRKPELLDFSQLQKTKQILKDMGVFSVHGTGTEEQTSRAVYRLFVCTMTVGLN